MATVQLAGDRITDWDSFHTESAAAFGFPDFYGRSMDAWVDCLS
ncbi:barstar family protein, partial [Salmonella enterica]